MRRFLPLLFCALLVQAARCERVIVTHTITDTGTNNTTYITDALGNAAVLQSQRVNQIVTSATFTVYNNKAQPVASGPIPEAIGADQVSLRDFTGRLALIRLNRPNNVREWHLFQLNKTSAKSLGTISLGTETVFSFVGRKVLGTTTVGTGGGLETYTFQIYKNDLTPTTKLMQGVASSARMVSSKRAEFTTDSGVTTTVVLKQF